MPDSGTSAPLSLPEAFARACRMAGPLEVRAVHRPTGAEQAVSLTQPFAILGRAPTATVRLDDPSVSQVHAYLQVIEGRPYCTDLGSRTGVVWEDGSRGKGWVSAGRVMRLGAFDVRVALTAAGPGGAREDPAEAEYRGGATFPPVALEVHTPDGGGLSHPLDRPLTLVGRHPDCHLRFLDDAVSYFHCAFVNTPDGAWCVDLLSRKGTGRNGRLIRLARLRDGDLVELGRVSLVVRTGDRPAGSLVVTGSAAGRPAGDALATGPQPAAEALAGALAPVRQVMEQFQQCFVTMARVFDSMQREHAALVGEQMRQMREMMEELRELRGLRAEGRWDGPAREPAKEAPPPPPPAEPPAPPPPKMPTPKPSDGAEAAALSDAHAWFLDRLAKVGQFHPGNHNSQ